LFPVLEELARAWARRTGAAPDEAERRIRELAWAEFRARAARGDPVRAYNWQAIVEAVALSVGERFDGSLGVMVRPPEKISPVSTTGAWLAISTLTAGAS
ncbi:MAG: hypothetical protein HGB10_08130, partial [Coriobacteriia bacterium]|nr:hypothetical protein [Coriobacteriia bacterium]